MYYEKYRKEAEKEWKEGKRFSKAEIMERAYKAELDKKMISDLNSFMDFAGENEEVEKYLYLRYYTVYQSGESFKNYAYNELPQNSLAEEKFPGFCEVVIGLAAKENFLNYIKENNIEEFIDEKSYYNKIRTFMHENKIAHNTYGLVEYGNFVHSYAIGDILRIGRLIFEKKPYEPYMEVYKKGDSYIKIALPIYSYTDEGYIAEGVQAGQKPIYKIENNILYGQTYFDNGRLCPDTVKIPLSEYTCLFKAGDPVLYVHIPGEGRLIKEDIDKAFEMMKEVVKREKDYLPKALVSTSWLIDPALQEIMSETSNIIAFQKRFRPISITVNSYSLYKHIFEKPVCPVEMLVPQNSFQEKILNRIKSGIPLRNGHGFLDVL